MIRHALEQGVNFIDTAQLYGTYPHIARALVGWDKPVVIATKSYAYTREGMKQALEEARSMLQRDVIEVFLLHEQESAHTIRGHWPAFEVLLEAKAKGVVKAVGISTHTVGAVRSAAQIPEIDVISPLINLRGIGIVGGTRDEMLEAIRFAYQMGKGLYGMKPLAGGHLYRDVPASLQFALSCRGLASVAVGMQTCDEVDFNIACLEGRLDDELMRRVKGRKKQLHIETWCAACGVCVDACGSKALALVNGKLVHNEEKCVLCGYCGARCPEFALKII